MARPAKMVQPRNPIPPSPFHPPTRPLATFISIHLSRRCAASSQHTRHYTFHRACSKGYLPIVKHVVESDHVLVNVDEQHSRGWTPLMVACRDGHVHVFKYLFESNRAHPDIAAKEEQGNTFFPSRLHPPAQRHRGLFGGIDRYRHRCQCETREWSGQHSIPYCMQKLRGFHQADRVHDQFKSSQH